MAEAEAAAQDTGTDEGTALEGAGAGEGTALEEAGQVAGNVDQNATIEIPDKFKNEDGKLNEQNILKSYTDLEKSFRAQGKLPDSADGYKVETKFPDGVKVDEDGQKEFLGRCYDKGLSNETVQFMYDEYAALVSGAVGEQAETREGTVAQLKEVFGDKYGDKMIAAKNAFNAAGIEGLDIKEVGNNSAMIQILAELGANLTEDQLPDNVVAIGSAVSDEEIQTLMRSPEYWDSKKPGHLEVKNKVEAYYAVKFRKRK